jgi:hypothetical protein
MRRASRSTTQLRIADRPDAAGLEIHQAVDVVDDPSPRDVVEEPVDREIPPKRVLLAGAEHVVARHQGVVPLLGRRRPERGDLDDARAEAHVDETEAAADDAAVAEKPLDLARAGVGGDVEVLGRLSDEQVAHAAAHEVGVEAVALEPSHHLRGVGVDRVGIDPVGLGRRGGFVLRHRAGAPAAGLRGLPPTRTL